MFAPFYLLSTCSESAGCARSTQPARTHERLSRLMLLAWMGGVHRSKEQPEGYISLVVAENRLSFDLLRPKLQKILSRPLPAELGTYDQHNPSRRRCDGGSDGIEHQDQTTTTAGGSISSQCIAARPARSYTPGL